MSYTESLVEEYLYDFLSTRRELVELQAIIKDAMLHALTAYKTQVSDDKDREISCGGYIKSTSYR